MGGRRFAYILVLFGVVLIASVNGEKSTSPGCKVVQLGKKLQCRGAGLSEMPKIPRGILIADFTDNLITHITQEDWKHLEKLQKVYLKGNPFHCDCNLEWLRLKLDNSPAVIQDGDGIQCATPSKIHNKHLRSLSNLCDIREHTPHSQPIPRVQKRNAQAKEAYIDKCKDKNPPCEVKQKCIDQNGTDSQSCGCYHGFVNDKVRRIYINECEKTPNICSGRYVICTNTNGSYECNCKEGYYNTTDGCQDINECNTGAHKCDETTSKCQNTIGGHFCMCRTGFNKTQDKCVDIDECKANPDICGDKSATCKNTIGSYECICKNTGYKHNRIARRCLDIDECVKKPCGDKNMICQNSQGSYSCECKPHYRKDGNACKDIDECADKSTVCEGDMKCINTLGSFKCECDHGFLPDAYRKCKDLDECKVRKHNCSKQSYCRNTLGSFKCVCPKGYEGDGVTKCSPNKLTRFTTPKYLLKDLVRGAWDSILVVLSAGVIGICLLVIIILTLKKMCLKCSKCGEEKELAQYQEQLFYHEEMYDPDQMFFPGADHEQMFYPEETGYPGDDVFYPEGMDYPEGTGYLDEAYYDDVTKPIPMTSVDPSYSVPHTYYGDDQDDEPSDDNAEGVPYEQY